MLLAITGRPGVGKTTIAQALAMQLGWPGVQRDACMAGYVSRRPEHVCRISTSMRRFFCTDNIAPTPSVVYRRSSVPTSALGRASDHCISACRRDCRALPHSERIRIGTHADPPIARPSAADEDYITQQQATTALEWVAVDLSFPTADVDALQHVEPNVATILAVWHCTAD